MYMHGAKWLTYETGGPKGADDPYGNPYGNPSPCFRKKFEARGGVERAALDVSAVGVFKAYLNGEAVAGDYMSPGWTDYSKRIPLYTFDATDKIRARNAVAIVAGDGWAVGKLPPAMLRCAYFEKIEVCARLIIDYRDGKRDVIVTDLDWEAAATEIRRSDIFSGEYVDKRLSLPGFALYGGGSEGWGKPSLNHVKAYFSAPDLSEFLDRARVAPTVVKRMLPGKFLHKTADGKFIYDFGQNFTGVVRAELNGDRGATLVFRHGEVLNPDGTLYTANLRRVEATDTVILAGGGAEEFRPLFTFHGFRYAEVAVQGKAEILSVRGEAMYSDLRETGAFSCSDPLVNQLYSNLVWGQRSNFLNLPTDCPQRDERLGWSGDAQIFCGTAMFNMDCRDFYRKYLTDIRDAQLGAGAAPCFAPAPFCRGRLRAGMKAAAGWSDVITILPYEYYLMYGDKAAVKENLEAAKGQVRYYAGVSENYVPRLLCNYGDWLGTEKTDTDLVAVCYFALSAKLCAKLCRIAGDGDADIYEKLYADIREAFRSEFIGKDGAARSDTQTAYLLPYAFGLTGADETRPRLLAAIARQNDRLSTGFLGVKYLLPVLCELGESALAYKLLTNTDYPSWLYSVVNGATTMWERWDGYTDERGVQNPDMNSFNHYAYGSCGEWMYKYCLGINPVEGAPGFKKVLFRPFIDPGGKITRAEGCYQSVNGAVKASWRADSAGAFLYETEVADGIEPLYDFGGYKSAERRGEGAFLLKVW
ncbi:MAG: glycoside hydrolase family 78 protein [Clostridiales bacterium]|jgi:alpha-L-rhamnosidase|nr:glycoside hydrolase family 78 protein [Clostridiales bacterium]